MNRNLIFGMSILAGATLSYSALDLTLEGETLNNNYPPTFTIQTQRLKH
jgi:hypothetical protein